jgi:hypothetical protein
MAKPYDRDCGFKPEYREGGPVWLMRGKRPAIFAAHAAAHAGRRHAAKIIRRQFNDLNRSAAGMAFA